jgi:GT2 family glycosyltransferase
VKDLSIVIINYNGGDDLTRCLESLKDKGLDSEIILVDNGSSDGSERRAIAEFPGVRLVASDVNLGFAGGANLGALQASGRVLLFMNPDVLVESGCLRSLVSAIDAEAGVAGPILDVEASGCLEYGARFDWFAYSRPLLEPSGVLYVPGCALATPRSLFDRLGGFDDRYFMFVEDVDYCWRVQLSGKDVVVPLDARALHKGGGSTPGGYGKIGRRKRPTTLRMVMRERNSLTTILKCAPVALLPLLIPAFIAQALVTAIGSLLLGNVAVFSGIFKGLWWNLSDLPATLKLRRLSPTTPEGEKRVRRLIDRGSNKLKVVLGHGLPRFVRRSDA